MPRICDYSKCPIQWQPYLAQYAELDRLLRKSPWFPAGWKNDFYYLDQDSPRVVFTLTREEWFDGAVYLKTRITTSDIKKRSVRVGLHVETSIPRDGVNRAKLVAHLVKNAAATIHKFPGFELAPRHLAKPVRTQIPLDLPNHARDVFHAFHRLHQLDRHINAAIAHARVE